MMEQKRARSSIRDSQNLPFIHQDIIIDHILFRLPTKSLGRYKSVSKLWNSIISSTAFTKLHLQNQRSNNHMIIQATEPNRHLAWLNHHLEKLKLVPSDLVHGYETLGKNQLIGICNGLICICITNLYNGKKLFLIWNPTTHEKRLVPGPTLKKQRLLSYFMGFGYDSSTDDYKVILVYRQQLGLTYSLKKDEWKNIDVSLVPSVTYKYVPRLVGVLVGEILHWLIEGHKRGLNLLVFDLSKESFSIIPLPLMLDRKYREGGNLYLCKVNESLCAHWVRWPPNTSLIHSKIWTLEKYGVWDSWKLESFKPEPPSSLVRRNLFEFGKNELVQYVCVGSLASGLDDRSSSLTSSSSSSSSSSLHDVTLVCGYEETLISPNLYSGRALTSATEKRIISSYKVGEALNMLNMLNMLCNIGNRTKTFKFSSSSITTSSALDCL